MYEIISKDCDYSKVIKTKGVRMEKKDIGITLAKSAISCVPWAGGIINEFISLYQGEYTERRLEKIEKLLGKEEKKKFEDNINNLSEEEYFLARRIIKFHLFEADPIVSDALARFIVKYILDNNRTQMNYLLGVLCELDSNDILLLKKIQENCKENENEKIMWSSISPCDVTSEGEKSKITLYSLIATSIQEEDTKYNLEFNILGNSFMKLEKLNIVVSDFLIYPGENNVRNVESFRVTALGKMIMNYI